MTQPQKTSLLAVFSLVFAFLCFPIGAILGIIAIMKINNSGGELGGKGLAIAGLVISLAVALPGVGCTAAIAVPNFVKFQCRSKQSEAKANLKALYVAEEIFRGERDRYSSSLEEIEFQAHSMKPRYDYEIVEAAKTAFTARATAKPGTDIEGDVWTIDQDNNLQNVANGCQ